MADTGIPVVDTGGERTLGLLASVVIGVASTAPGYSLAATLGFVITAVGFQAPAIMILAFVPMGCIASAYSYLNRAEGFDGSDCARSALSAAADLAAQLGTELVAVFAASTPGPVGGEMTDYRRAVERRRAEVLAEVEGIVAGERP